MTEADRIFARFPNFIKEFIYSHSWDSLREVQIQAAKTIFETDHNLLLTSSTASGKTEAAFFPVLADVYASNDECVSVLYIAPLKSLINDQFERIEELLQESGIHVTHWHGDVAMSHKKKMLMQPRGILQITPESLESMLINRSNDIVRLFYGLKYIIIDEIHTLTGSDRGNQILCQLCRLDHLIGHSPRRIGLSATIGDPGKAAAWLSAGCDRVTDIPDIPRGKIHWRLGMEHFYIQNASRNQVESAEEQKAHSHAVIDAGYEFMYDCVRDKKSIVFSNSREETEYVTATLRQIARNRGDSDIFLIHHGNLSASLREEAEAKMKDDEQHAVTCATVTMELGIDIGRLERILQNDSPNSVSSFLQRLGRSGRRGQPPEMVMAFREEDPLPDTPLPQLIPWSLIRAIAIVQLYIEESFIEPPSIKKLPFSLLFHQMLSILASSGELSPKKLAERVLGLPPFVSIPKEDCRTLMLSMLNNGFLELTDEGTLIVGLEGEKLLKSFKFYAVFKDTEDFTVRCGSEEIGTITTPPPVGDRFALAGRVWEVKELDITRKLVYVESVQGKMEVSWPGDYGEIHTRILQRMRRVLSEDTVYPYLLPNAVKRLETARHLVANTHMTERSIIHLGGYNYCMFPWLGTRSFRTLRKYIKSYDIASRFKISNVEFEGCCYITFRMERGDCVSLAQGMRDAVRMHGIDPFALVGGAELPVFEKYDRYVPAELLRKAYAIDKLDPDEASQRLLEIASEMITDD